MFEQIDTILADRGKLYGDFDHVARVSQELKSILRAGDSWKNTSMRARESLDMICNKMARIVCGDPTYKDSWVDIQGYAKLVSDNLQ